MRNAQFRVNIDRSVALRGFKAPRLRSVARYGDRPCPNILRGLAVCIVLVATLLATEVKAFSVGCRDMAAGTTPTACISGTDRFQFDANGCRLVCDLESHIGIRPAVDFGSEVFPLAQRSISNVLQVFHHDAPCSDLNRVADQCLGGDMQEMSRYGSLVSSHSPQEATGRPCSNGLDFSAGAPDTRTAVIEFTPVEEKCFTVGRVGGYQHALDTHVDSNNRALALWFGDLNLVSQAEIPLFSNPLDLGIFPSSHRNWAGVIDNKKFSPEGTALQCSVEVALPNDRHDGARKLSQPPSLVRLSGLVGGADHLAEGTGQLRWESHLAKLTVMSLGQAIGVEFPSFEGNPGKPVGGLQPSINQPVSLRAAGNLDLDCADCFHWIKDYCLEKTMSNGIFASIEPLTLNIQSQQTKTDKAS